MNDFMKESGQLTFGISIILLFVFIRIRTANLTKVDNNHRIRAALNPTKELYQGRILRYLFSFKKEMICDSNVEKEIIKQTRYIDNYIILFIVIFLLSLFSFL